MNNQVHILFTQVSPTFKIKKYESYHRALPEFLSGSVNNYINYLDQVLGILGKHLLLRCLKKLNIPESLASYDYDTNRRPFLKEFQNLDFNISHSGNIVMCAASLNMRIGIDIEQEKPIQLSNFKRQLSSREWKTLQEITDWQKLFFQYWVKKEAIAKTDGNGISLDFSKVEVLRNNIFYNNKFWLFTPLSVHPNYPAFLATDKIPALQLEEIFF